MPSSNESRGPGAELLATSTLPVLQEPHPDAPWVTEVIAGETVRITETEAPESWYEEYLKVVVPAHASRLDKRGYPGWIRADAPLLQAPGWRPDALLARENPLGLPPGAGLRRKTGGYHRPDGERVTVDESLLLAPGERLSESVLQTARRFPAPPYVWGGTDATRGMDCSGFVYRVLRLHGATIPRDADDQFDALPFRSTGGWEAATPGDLVFFGKQDITHVGFYLGGGRYLSESGKDGTTSVRDLAADDYQGFGRYVE